MEDRLERFLKRRASAFLLLNLRLVTLDPSLTVLEMLRGGGDRSIPRRDLLPRSLEFVVQPAEMLARFLLLLLLRGELPSEGAELVILVDQPLRARPHGLFQPGQGIRLVRGRAL